MVFLRIFAQKLTLAAIKAKRARSTLRMEPPSKIWILSVNDERIRNKPSLKFELSIRFEFQTQKKNQR